MKIFLIGMPGSGKSTVGQQLATALNLNFVDLDVEIERHEQTAIEEIFKTRGEEYFRSVESAMLRQFATGETDIVISTGGGAPCFHQGIEIINENGLSVFLDESIATLLHRVKNKKHRPLLNAADVEEMRVRLEQIRARRLECYQKASITVQNATLTKVMEAIKLRS